MPEDWGDYVAALVPSIGMAVLFFVVIRGLVFADRREREARRREDLEDDLRRRAQ